MYAIIEDHNGNEEARIPMHDDEVMDAEYFAEVFSGGEPVTMANNLYGGAYYVVFREDPDNTARCFSRTGFYIGDEA